MTSLDNSNTALQELEAGYNPQMGLVSKHFHNPGYHTKVPSGEWAHPVLDNFDYAHLLLAEGGPERVERARQVLEKLLTLQDVQLYNATYGIWPWLADEPLTEMAPPDWNWADFCGGRLACMLVAYREHLPADLLGRMEQALGHAARSIFRRNIQPGYTNIAVMGGVVCGAAGEMLGEQWLLDYARERLGACAEHARFNGDFTEFNSPAYTPVVVKECERSLFLLKDPQVREHIEFLWKLAWQGIARHYHPGTQQWAGPHSRSYSDLIAPEGRVFLIRRLPALGGESIDPAKLSAEPDFPLPCPAEYTHAFALGAEKKGEFRQVFVRNKQGEPTLTGVTWSDKEACISSATECGFWTQHRPLIGYWSTPEGTAVLRLRFLKDGKDFASGQIRCAQRENRILSCIYLANGMGAWHPTLDRPADGVFRVSDLRLRYELTGKGASVADGGDGTFTLAAGGWQARIQTAPAHFGDLKVSWETGSDDSSAWVDAVYYSGPEIDFSPKQIHDLRLGAGLSLLSDGKLPPAESPTWEPAGDHENTLRWHNLAVRTPNGAVPHQR